MFKFEQVKNCLNCEQCTKLLVEPVTIVCGFTVCKSHLQVLLEESMEDNKFKCELCFQEHTLPDEGWVINRSLQRQLELELNTLKPSSTYEDCRTNSLEIRKIISEMEKLDNDPECYLYEYFAEIKRQVDLRREILVAEVDSYRLQIIDLVERTKTECQGLLIHEKKASSGAESFSQILDSFNQFDYDEKKLREVNHSLSTLRNSLTESKENLKYSLTGNKEYTFVYKEINLLENFGLVVEFLVSIIVNFVR
jgi:hypothetical protein